MFAGMDALRRRSVVVCIIMQLDFDVIQISIDYPARRDGLEQLADGVDHSNPCHSEPAQIHSNPASCFEHFSRVFLTDDGPIELGQYVVYLVEMPEFFFLPLPILFVSAGLQREGNVRGQLVEQPGFTFVEERKFAGIETEDPDNFPFAPKWKCRRRTIAPFQRIFFPRPKEFMLDVIANGAFPGLEAAGHRSARRLRVEKVDPYLIEITIDETAGCGMVKLMGRGIDHSDPRHPKLAVFNGYTAGRLQHCPRIFLTDDCLVDVAQYGIKAIEVLNAGFIVFASGDVVRHHT